MDPKKWRQEIRLPYLFPSHSSGLKRAKQLVMRGGPNRKWTIVRQPVQCRVASRVPVSVGSEVSDQPSPETPQPHRHAVQVAEARLSLVAVRRRPWNRLQCVTCRAERPRRARTERVLPALSRPHCDVTMGVVGSVCFTMVRLKIRIWIVLNFVQLKTFLSDHWLLESKTNYLSEEKLAWISNPLQYNNLFHPSHLHQLPFSLDQWKK